MKSDPPVGIEINPPKTFDPKLFPSSRVPFRVVTPLKVVVPVLLLVTANVEAIVIVDKLILPDPVKL